jgi:hypothetical protein
MISNIVSQNSERNFKKEKFLKALNVFSLCNRIVYPQQVLVQKWQNVLLLASRIKRRLIIFTACTAANATPESNALNVIALMAPI